MSRSAVKIRDVRSTIRKETSRNSHRSASLDMRAARGSYIPERSRSSSDERKSGLLNRWHNSRRSSTNFTDAKRKDTRPLMDKAYQKRKVSELAQFLEEMAFSPAITMAKLMSPSKKDFENIFQFLYNCFDPTYEVKRIEEEGPKILKNLGYPFMVNKSAFVYVARTNWPTLLGILIWLMDLNKFAIKVDMKALFESSADDERSQMHSILLRYICRSYHSGVDNEEEENAVFSEIIKSFTCEKLKELEAIHEEKKVKLESVNKEIEHMKVLADRKVMLESNIKKYEDYIINMKAHCQKKMEICEQLMEEKKQKEYVLKALEEKVSKLQDLYDAQGFDGKKHVQYFEAQKKELSETLEKKRTLVKEMHDKLWESEIEYKKQSDKAISEAKSFAILYNSAVDQSKTLLHPLHNIKIPLVQKLCSTFHFEFPDFGISLNKNDKEFRKALNKIVENIKSTDEILIRIYDALKQQLNEIEMKKSELSAKLKLLSIQENQIESDLNSKKKQTEEQISALETQWEKTQQTVKALQTEKSELEKTYKEMCEELNSLQELRERKSKELKEYLSEKVEMFKYYERCEKEALKVTEEYGKEITDVLEELQQSTKL